MFKPFHSVVWIGCVVLAALAASPAARPAADKPAPPAAAFPLKVAEGGRYLVDRNGTPFLIAGESPQALMVNLSEEDAEAFFANRQSHGFNAVWINLLCRKGTGGRADGSTYDGLLPFELIGRKQGLIRAIVAWREYRAFLTDKERAAVGGHLSLE